MDETKKAPAKVETITVEGLLKIKKNSVISVFSDEKKIQPYIDKVRKEALVVDIDLKTKKGRDLIAGAAYKVSKFKTGLIKQAIDPSVAEYKAAIKSVAGGKKFFSESMDDLRDEIRAPLTEWEAAEKVKEEKRISDIKESISNIISLGDPVNPSEDLEDKEYLASMLDAVENIDCTDGFDEFTQDALQAKAAAKESLSKALNGLIQKEIEEKSRLQLLDQQKKLDEEKAAIELKTQAQARLNKLMMIPIELIGKSSEDIQLKINSLIKYEVPKSEFGDLYEQACESVKTVITQLEGMHQQQTLVEDAKAKDCTKAQELEEANTSTRQAMDIQSQQESSVPVVERVQKSEADPSVKKFKLQVEWSGYSRGYSIYEVEAKDEESAKKFFYEGKKLDHVVVRDDTESQEVNIIN